MSTENVKENTNKAEAVWTYVQAEIPNQSL